MENQNNEIGRIRQILFGHNVSEIEKRIEGFEQQMQNALDNLESRLARISESIAAAQKQIDELKVGLDDSNHQMGLHQKALNQSITEVGERLNEETGKVRKSINDTANDLRSEYARSVESQAAALSQLREQINARLSLLQSSKVDRTAMALLLNELALQLGSPDKASSDQITADND